MIRSRSISSYHGPMLGLLFFLAIALGCASGPSLQVVEMEPRAGTEGLTPGLSVIFFDGMFKHVAIMPSGDRAKRLGKPGKPVLIINNRFGEGPVYDSGMKTGVGLEMNGFIRFPAPGTYVFKAMSNDGARVTAAGKHVVVDPDAHKDRFSEPVELRVDRPGLYPIQVRYFQRRYTATLELYWKTPGAADFVIVPAEAYWH